MLKPKQLFIIIYDNVCVKIKAFILSKIKSGKANFPSHDRDCDDRITHLNHLVINCAVNKSK